jgi:hypothetical protein
MAKQRNRRTSKSQLGHGDVKKGVEISRKLQGSIMSMLENPEKSPISPSQIDATTRYLKENGLLLADLMHERNRRQVESGEGIEDGDEEPPAKDAEESSVNSCLPFTTDAQGNSIPNPSFKETPVAPKKEENYIWNSPENEGLL